MDSMDLGMLTGRITHRTEPRVKLRSAARRPRTQHA